MAKLRLFYLHTIVSICPDVCQHHRHVKATLLFLQKILLNKATYDMIFGCNGKHFGWKISVTIVSKIGILLN